MGPQNEYSQWPLGKRKGAPLTCLSAVSNLKLKYPHYISQELEL